MVGAVPVGFLSFAVVPGFVGTLADEGVGVGGGEETWVQEGGFGVNVADKELVGLERAGEATTGVMGGLVLRMLDTGSLWCLGRVWLLKTPLLVCRRCSISCCCSCGGLWLDGTRFTNGGSLPRQDTRRVHWSGRSRPTSHGRSRKMHVVDI